MKNKVSVVIVHWNTPDLLLKQLDILNEKPRDFLEIIVVDNSSENLPKDIAQNYPRTEFLFNRSNRGFAFACNQGLLKTSGEWVLFLNPDAHMHVAEIEMMVWSAEEKKLDACSPIDSVEYEKPLPTFQSLLFEFSPLAKIFPVHQNNQNTKKTLAGGHLLIKREVLEKMGGWDERFFLWFEDSDLSQRLDLNHSRFDILIDVKIDHQGGSSFKDINDATQKAIFFSSMSSFAEKYFSKLSTRIVRRLTRRYTDNLLLPADPNIQASIVVPNLKKELLEKFLSQNEHFFSYDRHELIVVTSCPDFWQIKKKYPEVIFIYNPQNRGFAHTVNLGLKRTRGQYLGTVNDDTILHEGWLDTLSTQFEKQVGSVAPCVLRQDGSIESCGITVLPEGKALPITQENGNDTVDTFNGACVLFDRSALEEVGLFDEKFGSYLEDIDLGLRLKNAGWQNKVTQQVKITHMGHQTAHIISPKKKWYDVQNWWFVMLKNYSLMHWLQHFPWILIERGRNFFGYLKSLN